MQSTYWDTGKENGSYLNELYRDYRVYLGIMEKKMEAILMGYIGPLELGFQGLG